MLTFILHLVFAQTIKFSPPRVYILPVMSICSQANQRDTAPFPITHIVFQRADTYICSNYIISINIHIYNLPSLGIHGKLRQYYFLPKKAYNLAESGYIKAFTYEPPTYHHTFISPSWLCYHSYGST